MPVVYSLSYLFSTAFTILVRGYEATQDAEGIAKAYSASKWTVYRLARQKRKTGSVALRTSQRGRKPVLTAEDKENIRQCIDEKLDITIEEIREKLSLSASYSTVERAINAMGYTLKKKSLYVSERDRIRCADESSVPSALQSRLNPIEKMWSKMKALLRGWKVRSLDLLPDAVRMALDSVSQLDCRHWFVASAYCQFF